MMRLMRAPWVLLLGLAAPCLAQDGASPSTTAVYSQVADQFDWTDTADFDAAWRGLVAAYPDSEIRAADGRVVWRFADAAALHATPVPPTVHPLLWRQQQLNAISGLFRVADGVYQVRGFDLANMTIIEGSRGVIVVDPLTSVEVASAALEFYFSHRPRRPVSAVIYTHSHLDHFGGVRGVVTSEEVASGAVPIMAPANFMAEAVAENLTAGNAMLRRTIYYSGLMLQPGPFGSVGAGLGPGVANGTQSFIAPTEEIAGPVATRTIDGVDFVFMDAGGTEAPSEFIFFLPQTGVLDVSEVAVHTMHNVLTPRGAKVRDAGLWAQVIEAMMTRFGADTEVLIGQHHWPSWGREAALTHLAAQRDAYKAVHDRALHLANQGVTLGEMSDAMERPAGLAANFAVQDHYGTFGSAGQATYQYYLGWYDGNPAHLNPLPSPASAARYVSYMGGVDAVLERARMDFAAGEYRWVAEVLDKVIFADPTHSAARELQAQTLTQLGYQQSSATWRNVYLTAARELRSGVVPIPPGARSADYLASMTAPMLLDYAGIALSPQRAAGADIELEFAFTDLGEAYRVSVADGLLHYAAAAPDDPAIANVALDRSTFDALLTQRLTLAEAVTAGRAIVAGDQATGAQFFGLFDRFAPDFPIVTP
jgi:alkyl sulfatase BDS1-like metallo-beta-lactamase superfamily hydrolase